MSYAPAMSATGGTRSVTNGAVFADELKTIDATIAARDASRYLPYPYLRPSNVPASIHI